MLLALPQGEIVTETPWTNGRTRFNGPLLKAVLDEVGCRGATLILTALNNYSVKIPVKDAATYPVILALTSNGTPMSIRDRGPLWVIYPWSDHPELKSETYYARSIWQLKSIHVE